MKRKKLTIALFLLILMQIPRASAYSELPEVDIQARSAILVHAQTDEVLFSHNIHIRREPASITKIMTVLLGIEYGGLDEVVTAEAGDFFDIVEGSSNAGIVVGEEMTLLDLLYCAMLPSANEACNMIARHIAGSVPAFVDMINARLADLGCENTHFANPHGLPDPDHYTTAYDIYLMARECVKNQLFMDIANTEMITLAPTNKKPGGRELVTTNNLITRRRFPDYIYPYARGIKTGSTNNAGYCLLSAAEKDGLTLISVVLGAAIDEETKLIRSFTETRDLFEWGFNNFTIKRILNYTLPLASVPVIQGLEQDTVELVPERSVEALVPKYLNPEDIERTVTVFEPGGVQAPVSKGEVMGEVSLSYEGHDYGVIPLLAVASVERDNRQYIQEGFWGFLDRIFGNPPPKDRPATEWPEGTTETSGSLSWIKWLIIGGSTLIVLYVLFVVFLNIRRRKRNLRPSNYRGRKRR